MTNILRGMLRVSDTMAISGSCLLRRLRYDVYVYIYICVYIHVEFYSTYMYVYMYTCTAMQVSAPTARSGASSLTVCPGASENLATFRGPISWISASISFKLALNGFNQLETLGV